jgi:N-acetylmuramoyl-L-alanine amidase
MTETNRTDIDTLARTIWGEARNQGVNGMAAVAAVIINRVKHPGWWGSGITGVCRAPMQFSCWNESDPNRAKLIRVDREDTRFVEASTIAELAAKKLLVDPTGGANHYHTHSVHPKWARGEEPTVIIGDHRFYRL